MTSGSASLVAPLALLVLGAACSDLYALAGVEDPPHDAGPSAGKGEGEGEADVAPRCEIDEPLLYNDTFVPFCEPDADACDDVNDAPQANIDIVQVWSRRDGEDFAIVIELAALVPVPDDDGFLGISLMFDTDGDRAFGHATTSKRCYMAADYLTYEDGLTHNHRLVTVIGEEFVGWHIGLTDALVVMAHMRSTFADFDCAQDLRLDGRFFEIRVPFNEVVDVNGGVAYFLSTEVGYVPWNFREPTTHDLAFGLCAWAESRGGAPDGARQWELYPYGPCDVVEEGGAGNSAGGCEDSSTLDP